MHHIHCRLGLPVHHADGADPVAAFNGPKLTYNGQLKGGSGGRGRVPFPFCWVSTPMCTRMVNDSVPTVSVS